MAVFKAVVHSDYAQIPNETARDTSISFEARGVLTMLLSMPPNWEVHKSWVISQSKAGKDKVNAIFDELTSAGYIRKEEGQRKFGKFSSDDYFVFPTKTAGADFPQRSSRSGSAVNGESATTKETVKQKKHRTKETSIPPTGSTAPTGADSVCSVCNGEKRLLVETQANGMRSTSFRDCNHCQGTGKEPVKPDTPEQPTKADKPKPKTKAEKLAALVRSKPELLVCLNCLDDALLVEWCGVRVKTRASDSDRALAGIDNALNELRTRHGIAPDTAIALACDKGWTGLKVDWVLNAIPQNQRAARRPDYPENQGVDKAIHFNQMKPEKTELTSEQQESIEAHRKALRELTGKL